MSASCARPTTSGSEQPYDQVSIETVARAAGVSRQTVIRQFGTKDELAFAVVDWQKPREEAFRSAEPGDIDTAIARLVDRYEVDGRRERAHPRTRRPLPRVRLPPRGVQGRSPRVDRADPAAGPAVGRSRASRARPVRRNGCHGLEAAPPRPRSRPGQPPNPSSSDSSAPCWTRLPPERANDHEPLPVRLWDGGGAVAPELGVARRLISRGHDVRVIADPTLRDSGARDRRRLRAVGRRAAPHQRRPAEDLVKDWEVTQSVRGPAARCATASSADRPAPCSTDTAEQIAAYVPDALVADYFLFGAMIAAQGAGLPVAALVPNIWALPVRGVPPIAAGFPLAKGPLGRARDAALVALVNRVFAKGLPSLNATRRRARATAPDVVLRPGAHRRPHPGAHQPDVRLRRPLRAGQRALRRADPRRARVGRAVDPSVDKRPAAARARRAQLHLPEPGGAAATHHRRDVHPARTRAS